MRWGYVSTSGGLGWVGLVRHEGRDGVGQKKNRNFSCARAFLECLVVMHGIVHVTPRTAVAKKNPLTQKKKKKKGRETETGGEHGTGRGVSGAPRACVHVHPPRFPSRPAHVDFDAHHVSTACACDSIPQLRLAPSPSPRRQPRRGHGHGHGQGHGHYHQPGPSWRADA